MGVAPETVLSPAPSDLPRWQDHADRLAVIYDGQCRFCRAGVKRLAAWDWHQRLAFVSLHDPLVAQHWPHLSHDDLMQQMYVITPAGDSLGGARGLRYLARQLPPLWPLVPWLYLPGTLPLWQFAYRLVARLRYRIAGRHDACEDGTCSIHGRK